MPAQRSEQRSASAVALLWIAVAILGWAVVAPSLHSDDHGEHADACPYCQPIQSGAFVAPMTAAPTPDDEEGPSIVADRDAVLSARAPRTDRPRGPPARI